MADLKGKTVVIVGGVGLLGSAFSRACATAGANVIIGDIDAKKGGGLAKEISGSFVQVDISDPASVEKAAKEVAAKHGKIDGVVNATYPKTKNYARPFEQAEQKDILENLDLQIGGCFSTIRSFSPIMKEQKSGSIVLMGSIYGIAAPRFAIYEGTDMVNPPEYAVSKAGAIALARYFASYLGKYNIRINAISPGGILDKQPGPFIKAYSKHAKLGPGMLTPEDVAGALVFLFSDASKQMTGQNLVIDGGWTL